MMSDSNTILPQVNRIQSPKSHTADLNRFANSVVGDKNLKSMRKNGGTYRRPIILKVVTFNATTILSEENSMEMETDKIK